MDQRLDQSAVTTIRTLAIDTVQAANSGHPGAPMGCAPMAHTIWSRHLRHAPATPSWFNRDRFLLSNGPARALLYSLIHLAGYGLTLEPMDWSHEPALRRAASDGELWNIRVTSVPAPDQVRAQIARWKAALA